MGVHQGLSCCDSPANPAGARARLALCVLRSLTGPLQAVLLALLHPWVTSQQAGLLQSGPVVRVVLDERTGDAVRDGAGLAARATADHLDADVELSLRARDAKRRERRHLEDAAPEVRKGFLVVDQDPPLARLDAHSRDCVLAAAGPPEKSVSQV